MPGSVIFILVSTLFVGIITGFYAYFFTGGPSKYSWDIAPASADYTITVDLRGTCELSRSCASHRIDSDGRHTALLYDRSEGEFVRTDYEVSLLENARINDALKSTDFEMLERELTFTCDTEIEDVYHYTVEIGDRTYTFRMCSSEVRDGMSSRTFESIIRERIEVTS